MFTEFYDKVVADNYEARVAKNKVIASVTNEVKLSLNNLYKRNTMTASHVYDAIRKISSEHNDTLDALVEANREHQDEIDMINYLFKLMPPQMSDEAVGNYIMMTATQLGQDKYTMKDMGRFIGIAKSEIGDRVDNKRLSTMVRNFINNQD